MQSDSRLVRLFRRGVEPAFDELVNRYRGALVTYAGAIAGHDRAEDVVQDSLVKAHRSLSGDQPIEPKPWLYTVVRNTALNDIRDNSKHSHDMLGETASRVAPTHEVAERREELAAIVAAVSDLPESQRRALIGHELGGFSHEEIATELKLSTAASAKQLIYRARLTLRNAVGAMIPLPLIAWLVSDATGLAASGAATGAAAGGAIGAASGGATMGTASGGFFAGLAGAGTAKFAVVAVVAGGSLATGVAVEEHKVSSSDVTVEYASASSAGGSSGGGGPGVPTSLLAVVNGTSGDASHDSSSASGSGSKNGSNGSEDSPGSGSGSGLGSGSGESPKTGDDGPAKPPVREGSTSGSGRHGSDDDSGDHEGSSGPSRPSDGGHRGPGGDDDPAPPTGDPGGDDDYVPPAYAPKPKPPGDSGSGSSGSGSSGSGSFGSGSSGSYGSSGSGSSGSGHEDDGPEHDGIED